MMKVFITILLVVIGFVVNAQTPRPTGFPSRFTTTWEKVGYPMADSGLIAAPRDTVGWLPRFSGTIVMRPQDRNLYWYDSVMLKWNRIARFGDTAGTAVIWGNISGDLTDQTDLYDSLLARVKYTDTLSMLAPYLQKVDTTNKWITSLFRRNDSVFYVKGGASIFAFIDSIGSTGGVTEVNSGFGLTGGPIITTGTLLADTTRGTGLPSYYYVDSSVAGIAAGGINNTNIGSGFRVLSDPSTQTLRTLFTDITLTLDSTSNSDALTLKVDTAQIATQYDLTQITTSGNAGGDLNGTYPNPRLAHSVTGTGDFLQVKNSTVIGDTIERLGQIFNDNFARASLGSDYGTAGTQTIAFPSSAYLEITGTTNYSNNIFRTSYTAVNRWIDSVRFTTGTLGGSTFGLLINVYDPTNYQTGIRVQFGCATAVTNIYFRYYDGTQLATGTGNLGITGGDSLLAIVERRDNTFICTYRNLTTGAAPVTLTHTFSTLSSAAQPAPASGRMAIGSLGGVQNVSYWSHTSSEVKNQSSVVGNSIASGGYTATTISNSWPNKIFFTRDQWARLGGAGDRSADAINYIPQVVSISPRILYYSLGVNDALNSVTGATYSANVEQFLDTLAVYNITPILVELPPQNTVLSKPYSDTLAAIAARRGLTYITGIYDALRTGTAYNAAYSTDGIHPNDAGHLIIANLVKAQSPATANYNLTLLNIPADSTANSRILQIEEDGHTTVGINANTVQVIGRTVRVGDQMTLPSSIVPAISATLSSPNGFINIMQNSSSTGWTGSIYRNSSNTLVYGEGWQNSGVASGNGAVSDSTFMWKTYNRATGRFAFFAGDNQTTNAFADLIIYRGSVLPGRHVAAGRTVNPVSGMFYYDTDSSEFVIHTGSAWVRYSRTGIAGFVNPMTTAGDIITGGASGTPTRLAMGTANQQIRVNAGATALEYFTPSGTFSPALTNTANIASSATYQGQWLRIGNTVTLSGQFIIDPDLPSTLTQLTLTLPIASTLGDPENLSGVASDGVLSAKIYSNGSGAGILEFNSVGTAATTWTYTLTYTIN